MSAGGAAGVTAAIGSGCTGFGATGGAGAATGGVTATGTGGFAATGGGAGGGGSVKATTLISGIGDIGAGTTSSPVCTLKRATSSTAP
ncbi:MAG: hypothetical protein WDN48_07555 [Pseudolabrys sp.]